MKRNYQSYGFMCIFNSCLLHHKRVHEVKGIDVVLRGIKDHKKNVYLEYQFLVFAYQSINIPIYTKKYMGPIYDEPS